MIPILIILAVWFFGTVIAISQDSGWGASILLLATAIVGGAVIGFTEVALYISTIHFTILGIAACIIGWFVIGTLWSFFMFYRRVRKNKTLYKNGTNDSDIPTIAMWITYWPFSAISYLIGDLVREGVRWIIRKFNGIYTNIIKYALRD